MTDDNFATSPSLIDRLCRWELSDTADQDWRSFVDIYQPMLLAYAQRRGLDPASADDVVQEILLGITKGLPGFNYLPEKCRFRTWLFRVAERKVMDHWRRSYRQLPELQLVGDTGTNDVLRLGIVDTTVCEPDAAWDAKFEEELLHKARRLAGQRVNPMNFRLYLYHVVKGHDVAATVEAFKESRVTAAQVHMAKLRVAKLVEDELRKLWRQFGN